MATARKPAAKKAPAKRRGRKAGLTAKNRMFAHEYIIDLNAQAAAIRAGYSEKTAGAIGFELLNKPEVAALIEELKAARAERCEISADRVLNELAKIGFSDIRKAVKWRSQLLTSVQDPDTGEAAGVYTNTVELVNSSELDDETAAAISSVSQTDKGALKITFHDKKGALEQIGRHLGMFNDKLHVEIDDLDKLNDDELDEYIDGLDSRIAALEGEGAAPKGAKSRAKPPKDVSSLQ